MKKDDITQQNRDAWEEAAPVHHHHNQAHLIADFGVSGHTCLDEIETELLKAIGLEGKDVAQLCCNNGRELISVKNMGAARCVGFEGTSGFVSQARELNTAAGQDCEFVEGDVYAIPAAFDADFDLVTVTIGVFNWMPDIDGFFAVAARLLRPGGKLFVYEQHPILDMIKPGGKDDPVEWAYAYFDAEPYKSDQGLDYFAGEPYASKQMFEFTHTLSDVITAGLNAGLRLEHFKEYPHHISNTWYNVEHQGPPLPMSYTLIMEKVAD